MKWLIQNTKNMLKNNTNLFSYNNAIRAASGLMASVTIFSMTTSFKVAHAQTLQEQIDQLKRQNAQNRYTVDKLQDVATSYEDAIEQLKEDITDKEKEIDLSKKKQTELEKQIKQAEAQLEKQKNLLGENIRAMYVEGDISTIEMLASSKDLSEFIDKEQYRNSVKDKISDAVKKINNLRNELKGKKEQVDKLLNEQKDSRVKLASSKAEKANLLSYNEAQQQKFNSKIQKNADRIAELVASQRSFNFADGGYYFIRFPGSIKNFNPNNYEYRNYGHSQVDEPCPGPPKTRDSTDRWGYCTRQCVSYAAWAVYASGRKAPVGWGDAKEWVGYAYANGVPVYRTPKRGDIAISINGYWGHAMYVDSVSGSTFNTSEYNTNMDGQLYYRTRNF